MENIFIGAGLACVIAAVAGGGLKGFGIEVPVLASLRRQIVLGVLGVVLVIVGIAPTFFSNRAPQADSINAGTASPGPVTTPSQSPSVPVPSPPVEGGPIVVNVNNSPRVVPAGGSTDITVFATSEDGRPLAGVHVVISAGGGVFSPTGATRAVGDTDAQGVFRTTWRTYEASAYTGDMSYGMGIKATKDNYTPSDAELTIPVHK